MEPSSCPHTMWDAHTPTDGDSRRDVVKHGTACCSHVHMWVSMYLRRWALVRGRTQNLLGSPHPPALGTLGGPWREGRLQLLGAFLAHLRSHQPQEAPEVTRGLGGLRAAVTHPGAATASVPCPCSLVSPNPQQPWGSVFWKAQAHTQA